MNWAEEIREEIILPYWCIIHIVEAGAYMVISSHHNPQHEKNLGVSEPTLWPLRVFCDYLYIIGSPSTWREITQKL